MVRSKELGKLVSEVRKEGVFVREVSEADERLADMPGFKGFDPGKLRESFTLIFFTCFLPRSTLPK